MKCVILAGGFGTRLRPLTFRLPKPMVPLLGRPMMEHVVDRIREAGITEVISLLYFEPEIISKHFGDGSHLGVNMNYVLSQADWGTAGAVKNAAGQIDDTFLVMSGDVLTDFDLRSALAFHKEKGASATIVLTQVKKPLAYGIVITDPKSGKIERFLEKPAWGQVFSDTVNTGIYILEPHILNYIPQNEEFDFSKNLFPLLMAKGEPLFGFVAEGYWRDVGDLREYRRANEDGLEGNIKLGIPGKVTDFDGAEVYVGEDVIIEKGATFQGKVLLGNRCKIGSGASIQNSVIGAGCSVGRRAILRGAVIWENTQLGDKTMVEHAIIANNVEIKDGVTIYDHAVVSEGCIIGNGASIRAAVKIWPRKEIAPNSVVTETLVHGDRTGGELFAGSRVSGVINSEISPEFAAKFGAAFGANLKGKGIVLVSRDGDRASQITERALFCGVMSSGVDVEDLGIAPIPVARWLLSRKPRSAGVHIRKSPRDRNGQDLIFFNGNGTDLSIAQTRSIERLFDREDFPRASYDSLGTLERPTESLNDYKNALIKAVDSEIIRKRKFKVVVDCSHGGTASVLPDVLSNIGIDSINVNAVVEPNRITKTRKQRDADQKRLAVIARSLEADAGFMLDPSGETLHLVDHTGRFLDEDAALCVVTDLFIRVEKPKIISVPISATMGVNRLTREAGIKLRYTCNNHLSMMESALTGENDFIGGTKGGFIFPRWLFASDAMFAVLKILEMMAKSELRLSDLVDELPDYTRSQRKVKCPFEKMGMVMRRLIEETNDCPRDIIDGVRIYTQDSWVLIIPDSEHPVFHLIAEAKKLKKLNTVLDDSEDMLLKLIS
ncbi:NTP transferase domain-containing protein [bacterium]|nr:NTP transferase domain-containing protein [bacterium]